MGASGEKQPRTRRRARALLVGLVLVMGMLVAACGPAEDPPPAGCPASPPDPIASTVLDRVNADRAARGLGGLAWNARLACLATEWSGVMASQGSLVHRDLAAAISSDGFGSYASLAENIFVGPGTSDGNMIHDAWMASPSHYANITGNYDSLGLGWAKSGDGRLWVTENFGRHR